MGAVSENGQVVCPVCLNTMGCAKNEAMLMVGPDAELRGVYNCDLRICREGCGHSVLTHRDKQQMTRSQREELMQGLSPEHIFDADPAKRADRWKNDLVQFARLISELATTASDGERKEPVIEQVARSMDVTIEDINELYDRAHVVWETAKGNRARL